MEQEARKTLRNQIVSTLTCSTPALIWCKAMTVSNMLTSHVEMMNIKQIVPSAEVSIVTLRTH